MVLHFSVVCLFLAYEAILSNVSESSANLTQAAIESQKVAVEATDVHTQKLKIALDDPTVSTINNFFFKYLKKGEKKIVFLNFI